jgi:hypothetical protein
MDLKIDAETLNPQRRRFVSFVQYTIYIKGCDGRIVATAHEREAQSEE